jgi:hypothetical protein
MMRPYYMHKWRLKKYFSTPSIRPFQRMDFRLKVPITPLEQTFHYDNPILVLGSCFAEEIGGKLRDHKFSVQINPSGILFNPLAIVQTMQHLLDRKIFTQSDLIAHDGLWHSFAHHGRFSHADPQRVLDQIQHEQDQAYQSLKELDWLVITLGSAYAYTHVDSGQMVANCHKLPGNQFVKKCISAEEMIAALDNMMHRLFFLNKKVKILFTVSPVRYQRDGIVENNLSKAILLQTVHHLVNKFNRLYYFPAYEIVMDELRDYRFFKSDLVHPNSQAIDYIWEQFQLFAMDDGTRQLVSDIEAILQAFQHKPIHADTLAHKQFKAQFLKRTQALLAKNPRLSLQKEISYFQS